MGRPREHDERTRQALLVAAEHLVSEGGVDAVGVRSAAEGAGTSTRAVYSVFGSKQALRQALARRTFDLLAERVDAVPLTDAPGEDLVRAAIYGFRAFALEHPDLFRLFCAASAHRADIGAEAESAASAAYDRLIQRIQRAHSAGILGKHSVTEVTLLWDAMCCGLAIREVSGMIDQQEAEGIWTRGLRALLAGLAEVDASTQTSRPVDLTGHKM